MRAVENTFGIDTRSELCKSCVHTNVCCKDKNLFGDHFTPGHPMFFDNDELYKKFKEREKAGFPCEDYFQEVVHCKDCGFWDRETIRANSNDFSMWNEAICKEHSLIGVNEPHEVWTDANWFCADGERMSE